MSPLDFDAYLRHGLWYVCIAYLDLSNKYEKNKKEFNITALKHV